MVTARRKEDLEVIVPAIEEWLLERGLVLHPEKTKIVHIRDGFDFLGFNIRQYHNTCLVKPQKKKVLALLQRVRLWLREHPEVTPEVVIRYLNPILRGWAMYYRHAVSKVTFDYVRHQVWMAIWRWCLRRHPKKSYRWIKAKYFKSHRGREWCFHAPISTGEGEQIEDFLLDVSEIPIQRHIKVRGDASPDNPSLREYWAKRSNRRRRFASTGRTTATYVRDLLEA